MTRLRLPRLSLRTLASLAVFAATSVPAVVAASALSHLGHRWTDILAQFTAPALMATVLLAAGAAGLRLGRAALGAALVALALLAAVWPQWFPAAPPVAEGPAVRVYAANLYARNRDVDAMAASIRSAEADIVMLVEYGEAPEAATSRLLAAYPHRVVSRRDRRPNGIVRSVIASRWPLASRPDASPDPHTLAAVAQTPLGPIGVVAVHLTRPWPFQYQWAQIIQADELHGALARLPRPLVVAGDFNSVSSARIGRQVQAQNGLRPAPGVSGSWPAILPGPFRINIDQVWLSPDLGLRSRRLGAPTGSDHRPVVVEIAPTALSDRRGG